MPNKTIFAIPGSLRAGSSNHHILRFLAKLAPAGPDFIIYDSLSQIPPFDPGLDNESPPGAVLEFRNFIKHAGGIIICTPEYAYGVPGQLKNALDWTVSSGSLVDKPLALITASTGGENAHAALLLILKSALGAKVLENATLLIPFVRSKMDGAGNVTDEGTENKLKGSLAVLLKAI